MSINPFSQRVLTCSQLLKRGIAAGGLRLKLFLEFGTQATNSYGFHLSLSAARAILAVLSVQSTNKMRCRSVEAIPVQNKVRCTAKREAAKEARSKPKEMRT